MNLPRALVLSVAVLFLASGCKSSSSCPSGTTKVNGQCVAESNGLADTTGGTDTTGGVDTNVPDFSVQDVPQFDTITCDAGYVIQNGQCKKIFDDVQPTVVKISVDSGSEVNGQYVGVAVSPTFQIDFSEAMQVNSVYGNSASGSLFVTDALTNTGVEISGLTFSNNNATVTFTVKTPLKVATVYIVKISTAAKDEAGNFLDKDYTLAVITTGPANTAKYVALARKYAPRILQGVDKTAPKWDLPLALDFDGEWNLKNNDNSATTATALKPYVYWTIRETTVKSETTKKSHFFITYVLYYPVANTGQDAGSGNTLKILNHTIGLTVIVEKDGTGKDVGPVGALLHYQQAAPLQNMRVYGVKGANFDATAPDVDKVYDTVNELFTNGTTFDLYIPQKLHAACAWVHDPGVAVGEWCERKGANNIVELSLAAEGAEPGEINTGNLKLDGSDTGTYQLKSFLNEVWPRRIEEGDGKVFNSNGTYTAPPNRPGTGTRRSVAFTGNTALAGSELGSTPFGWKESGVVPGVGLNDPPEWSTFTGLHFFDPAFLVTGRELITLAEISNWALDYCFNAYLSIEDRGNFTDCPLQ